VRNAAVYSIIELLSNVPTQQSHAVRDRVVSELKQADDETVVEPLVEILTDGQQSRQRRNAAWILGRVAERESTVAVEALADALADDDAQTAQFAATSLKSLGGPIVEDRLLDRLGTEHPRTPGRRRCSCSVRWVDRRRSTGSKSSLTTRALRSGSGCSRQSRSSGPGSVNVRQRRRVQGDRHPGTVRGRRPRGTEGERRLVDAGPGAPLEPAADPRGQRRKRTIPSRSFGGWGRHDANQSVARVSNYVSFDLGDQVLIVAASDHEAFERDVYRALLDQRTVTAKHPRSRAASFRRPSGSRRG